LKNNNLTEYKQIAAMKENDIPIERVIGK